MRLDLIIKLKTNYPELFSLNPDIDCGDGWYSLIDIICLELYSSFNSAKSIYEVAVENNGKKMYPWIESSPIVTTEMIDTMRTEMTDRATLLPRITQITEKFGTLRFYAEGVTEKQFTKIYFAQLLSSRLCELCGSAAPESVQCYAGVYKTRCSSCREK